MGERTAIGLNRIKKATKVGAEMKRLVGAAFNYGIKIKILDIN